MHLIILAAGKGTRMENLTDDRPKCLLEIAQGESFLSSQISAAEKSDHISKVVIVTGYLSESVYEFVSSHTFEIDVKIIENIDYDSSGPIKSIYEASEEMLYSDFILVNGDTWYSPALMSDNLLRNEGITLAASYVEDANRDDMKLKLTPESNIDRVLKDLDFELSTPISSGLVVVKGKEYREDFVNTVSRAYEDSPHAYWHSILERTRTPVKTYQIPLASWQEADTPSELRKLKQDMKDDSQK